MNYIIVFMAIIFDICVDIKLALSNYFQQKYLKQRTKCFMILIIFIFEKDVLTLKNATLY